ncbi:MAG: TetR/AcrR family transcriptional regulator [Spirochaetota bacterium]
MPGTRQTDAGKAILKAAEELFMEKGFARSSTTEIARRVGCNQALVHYYFRTKENLFQEVFNAKATLFLSAFLQAGETEETFEGRLRKRIEAHYDMLVHNPKLPFLILNELLTNPVRLEAMKGRIGMEAAVMFKRLQKEIDQEITRGTIRAVSGMELLLMIVSLNVFPFIAAPILGVFPGAAKKEFDRLIREKRKLNADLILNYLKAVP